MSQTKNEQKAQAYKPFREALKAETGRDDDNYFDIVKDCIYLGTSTRSDEIDYSERMYHINLHERIYNENTDDYENHPEEYKRCICGVKIKKQFFILHEPTKQILQTGRDCFPKSRKDKQELRKKVKEDELKRTCNRCQKVEKDRYIDICDECEIELKEEEERNRIKRHTCNQCGVLQDKPVSICDECDWLNKCERMEREYQAKRERIEKIVDNVKYKHSELDNLKCRYCKKKTNEWFSISLKGDETGLCRECWTIIREQRITIMINEDVQ